LSKVAAHCGLFFFISEYSFKVQIPKANARPCRCSGRGSQNTAGDSATSLAALARFVRGLEELNQRLALEPAANIQEPMDSRQDKNLFRLKAQQQILSPQWTQVFVFELFYSFWLYFQFDAHTASHKFRTV
jgi:hypothetical protein